MSEDRPARSVDAPSVDGADIVISVCVNCRAADADPDSAPGAQLLAALLEKLSTSSLAVSVRPVQCLSVCSRPCTVALSGRDRYTYVFGDLDPGTAATALLEGAATYAEQAHGYMLWRERPEALRRGIVARVPPSSWQADDGRHPR